MSTDKFEITEQDGIVVVHANGKLDTDSAKPFSAGVGEALSGCRGMIIDLTAVTYISSSAMRVVLFAAKAMTASRRRFCLCGLQEKVAEVFRLAGFDSILAIEEDLDAARAFMETPPDGK